MLQLLILALEENLTEPFAPGAYFLFFSGDW